MDNNAIWNASESRSSAERKAETLLPLACLLASAGAASGSEFNSVSYSGTLARSATISPSLISIIRVAFLAICMSWVTIMTV